MVATLASFSRFLNLKTLQVIMMFVLFRSHISKLGSNEDQRLQSSFSTGVLNAITHSRVSFVFNKEEWELALGSHMCSGCISSGRNDTCCLFRAPVSSAVEQLPRGKELRAFRDLTLHFLLLMTTACHLHANTVIQLQ